MLFKNLLQINFKAKQKPRNFHRLLTSLLVNFAGFSRLFSNPHAEFFLPTRSQNYSTRPRDNITWQEVMTLLHRLYFRLKE